MKNVYIQPTTELVRIASSLQVLTVSVREVEVKNKNYDESMTDLSRQNTIWDDSSNDE